MRLCCKKHEQVAFNSFFCPVCACGTKLERAKPEEEKANAQAKSHAIEACDFVKQLQLAKVRIEELECHIASVEQGARDARLEAEGKAACLIALETEYERLVTEYGNAMLLLSVAKAEVSALKAKAASDKARDAYGEPFA